MSTLFIAIIGVVLAVVLAWNFIPRLREKMRGLTTVVEAAIAAAIPFVGNAIDAFSDTDWKAFIPPESWPYIIGGLAGWFIFKRAVTTTPMTMGK